MPTDPLVRNNVRISGAGEPIVFAHGFGTDQRAWRFVAPAFEASHRTVLFDHVGFGGSDLRAFGEVRHATLDGFASDLLEVLDALDLHGIAYVGHSVGAAIGLIAALREPRRFARIVTLGASACFLNEPGYVGGFERHEIDGLLDLLETDQLQWAESLAPMAMGEQSSPALVEHFGDGLRTLDPLVARRFGRLAFLIDIRARVAALRVPTLVVQCANDIIAPREAGRFLHGAIPGSRYLELDASGHCPHLSHPEPTRQAIADYLRDPTVDG